MSNNAKTFERFAAQGDFLILRVDNIPENMERIPSENGLITVAHSETGHNHVMEAENVAAYKAAGTPTVDLYEMFLSVSEPTEITHLREFDTHAPLLVPPGDYKIFRQREYTPEGFRKAQD